MYLVSESRVFFIPCVILYLCCLEIGEVYVLSRIHWPSEDKHVDVDSIHNVKHVITSIMWHCQNIFFYTKMICKCICNYQYRVYRYIYIFICSMY